ncbi:VirD4-like conjugal transfer protein, CD1115 family [Desulfitobacterium chlororespirans]|uniref:Type IV secretion system protein VirD4 n=1 Tax=Desulfitobacterium chlororespirans DSM 11544 TaxID=1121395 RepID=A0A1M7UY97_9FIRM|nr:type IV secretion system protein VirD4 [Desulfitobacterium chlororespirans DSM 11544]
MNIRRRLAVGGVAIVLGWFVSVYFSTVVHLLLSTKFTAFEFPSFKECIQSLLSERAHLMLFLCFEGFWLLFVASLLLSYNKPYQSRMMQVTPAIETPVPAGQKQHGSARWMTDREKDSYFNRHILRSQDNLIKSLMSLGLDDLSNQPKDIVFDQTYFSKGGVALGIERKVGFRNFTEKIRFVGEDTHTQCIGATRSGKTRTVILESIGLTGLAGESMVCSDPKGELYQYTAPFLRRLGYEVYTIDFKNPLKSNQYNFLQTIIEAVDRDDLAAAVDSVWDLTANLVGEPKGERIWNDGEASTIAAAIMSVVYDNKSEKNQKYRNLTNVNSFIGEMTKTINNKLPLTEYVSRLPDNHPAKGLIAISEIAPSRTRGSFYTAALSTLRLFANNPSIHAMTSGHELDTRAIGVKKTAVFIILPDEKTTYYPLASLLVSQLYEQLVKVADERGGRLKRRVNFFLEEFGNFVKIPAFDNKLTVGGGRGIRFHLFLQSFAQLEEKYGREVARTIRGNCETWIYLQADDGETRKEISEKLGNYTVSSYSLSSSQGKYSSPSNSESMSLMSRALLTSDEVGRITRPYSLITSRSFPAIMYAPDLAQTSFNAMFGLGDMDHNTWVREMREKNRPQRITSAKDIELWGIWKQYQYACAHSAPQSTNGFI